jgi:DnaJ-class molecular chaperone
MGILDNNQEPCPSCDGYGKFEEEVPCPHCYGTGSSLDKGPSPLGSIKKNCWKCGDKRYIINIINCIRCGGKGYI